MKQKAREVKEALAKGGIDEAMKVTGLSQAQVYRYNKEVKQTAKKLNSNSVDRKVGKISARVKKHNREEAEKYIADEERSRINFFKKHFKAHPDDPILYHMMVNPGTLGLETSANVIVQALGINP